MNGIFGFHYNQELIHASFSTNTILFLVNLDYINATNRNFYDAFGLSYAQDLI